jgi:hypothetical protein
LPIGHIAEHDAEKFAKKVLGENEVEAALRRLDRLTQDEARAAAAQTLERVFLLEQNMRMVVDGETRQANKAKRQLFVDVVISD